MEDAQSKPFLDLGDLGVRMPGDFTWAAKLKHLKSGPGMAEQLAEIGDGDRRRPRSRRRPGSHPQRGRPHPREPSGRRRVNFCSEEVLPTLGPVACMSRAEDRKAGGGRMPDAAIEVRLATRASVIGAGGVLLRTTTPLAPPYALLEAQVVVQQRGAGLVNLVAELSTAGSGVLASDTAQLRCPAPVIAPPYSSESSPQWCIGPFPPAVDDYATLRVSRCAALTTSDQVLVRATRGSHRGAPAGLSDRSTTRRSAADRHGT